MADPVSVWQGEMSLLGVTLHLHVLDDGTRVIEAESMEAFMKALESGTAVMDPEEAAAFARWQRGGELPGENERAT